MKTTLASMQQVYNERLSRLF